MLKLSQINEGLWNKGLNRNKSGEKRLGDITELDKYIKDVIWVDLGHSEYLFAKYDSDNLFTVEDIINVSLPKDIKIMDYELFRWIFDYCENYRSIQIHGNNYNTLNEITSNRTEEIIYFIKYQLMKYIVDVNKHHDDRYKITFVQPCHSLDERTGYIDKTHANEYEFSIKLVKKK